VKRLGLKKDFPPDICKNMYVEVLARVTKEHMAFAVDGHNWMRIRKGNIVGVQDSVRRIRDIQKEGRTQVIPGCGLHFAEPRAHGFVTDGEHYHLVALEALNIELLDEEKP
jgi:hypothetical protein